MMLRFLWLALIAFLLFKLVRILADFFVRHPDADGEKAGGKGEELVKDPQCGAYFPKSEGVSETIDGERRHFCSDACRKKFLDKK